MKGRYQWSPLATRSNIFLSEMGHGRGLSALCNQAWITQLETVRITTVRSVEECLTMTANGDDGRAIYRQSPHELDCGTGKMLTNSGI